VIYGMYSVYDKAAKLFFSPTIDVNDDTAMRGFEQMLTVNNSAMQFRPDDYELYQVGTFDPETGYVSALVPPSRLYRGSDGVLNKRMMEGYGDDV
jgi:hypothetical protein